MGCKHPATSGCQLEHRLDRACETQGAELLKDFMPLLSAFSTPFTSGSQADPPIQLSSLCSCCMRACKLTPENVEHCAYPGNTSAVLSREQTTLLPTTGPKPAECFPSGVCHCFCGSTVTAALPSTTTWRSCRAQAWLSHLGAEVSSDHTRPSERGARQELSGSPAQSSLEQTRGKEYLLPEALGQRSHCMLGGAVEGAPVGCIGHPVASHGGDVDDVSVLPSCPHVLDQQPGLKQGQGTLGRVLSVAWILSWGVCPEGLRGRGRCRTGLMMPCPQSLLSCSNRRGVVHV